MAAGKKNPQAAAGGVTKKELAALRKRAAGFYAVDRKTIYKSGSGGRMTKTVEITEHYIPPDITALNMLLKVFNPEWHTDDSLTVEQKKQMLEIAKQRVDNAKWE